MGSKIKIGDKVDIALHNYPEPDIVYEGATVLSIEETEFADHFIYFVIHPDFILHKNGVWVPENRVIKKEF